MTRAGRQINVVVASDGAGLVSHAGSALLVQVADKTGLTRALSRELAGGDPEDVRGDVPVEAVGPHGCAVRGIFEEQDVRIRLSLPVGMARYIKVASAVYGRGARG